MSREKPRSHEQEGKERRCLTPRGSRGQGAAGTYLAPLPVARHERKGSKMELLVEDQTGLAPAPCGYGLCSSAFVPAELIEQPVNVTLWPWLPCWVRACAGMRVSASPGQGPLVPYLHGACAAGGNGADGD